MAAFNWARADRCAKEAAWCSSPTDRRLRLRRRLDKMAPGAKLACVGMAFKKVSNAIQRVQNSTHKRFSMRQIPAGFIVERIA